MQERVEDVVQEPVRPICERRNARPLRDRVVPTSRIVMQLRRIYARRRDLRHPPQRIVIRRGHPPRRARKRHAAGRRSIAALQRTAVDRDGLDQRSQAQGILRVG